MQSCVVVWIIAGWSNECKVSWWSGLQQAGKIECKVMWSSGLQQAGKTECKVMWSSGLQQAGKIECKVMWSYGLQQAGKIIAEVLCAPSHSCWWCAVAVVSACVHVGCKFWVYSLERTLFGWLIVLVAENGMLNIPGISDHLLGYYWVFCFCFVAVAFCLLICLPPPPPPTTLPLFHFDCFWWNVFHLPTSINKQTLS